MSEEILANLETPIASCDFEMQNQKDLDSREGKDNPRGQFCTEATTSSYLDIQAGSSSCDGQNAHGMEDAVTNRSREIKELILLENPRKDWLRNNTESTTCLASYKDNQHCTMQNNFYDNGLQDRDTEDARFLFDDPQIVEVSAGMPEQMEGTASSELSNTTHKEGTSNDLQLAGQGIVSRQDLPSSCPIANASRNYTLLEIAEGSSQVEAVQMDGPFVEIMSEKAKRENSVWNKNPLGEEPLVGSLMPVVMLHTSNECASVIRDCQRVEKCSATGIVSVTMKVETSDVDFVEGYVTVSLNLSDQCTLGAWKMQGIGCEIYGPPKEESNCFNEAVEKQREEVDAGSSKLGFKTVLDQSDISGFEKVPGITAVEKNASSFTSYCLDSNCFEQAVGKQWEGLDTCSDVDVSKTIQDHSQISECEKVPGIIVVDTNAHSCTTYCIDSSLNAVKEVLEGHVLKSTKADGNDLVHDSHGLNSFCSNDESVMPPGWSLCSHEVGKVHKKELRAKNKVKAIMQAEVRTASCVQQICEERSLDKDGGSSVESTAASGQRPSEVKTAISVKDDNSSVSDGSTSSPASVYPYQVRKKLDLNHQLVREIVKIQHDREQCDREQMGRLFFAQEMAENGITTVTDGKVQKHNGNSKKFSKMGSSTKNYEGSGVRGNLQGSNKSSREDVLLQVTSTLLQSEEHLYENVKQDSSVLSSSGMAKERENSVQRKQLQFMPIYRPPNARDTLGANMRKSPESAKNLVLAACSHSSVLWELDKGERMPLTLNQYIGSQQERVGMGHKGTSDMHKQWKQLKISEGPNPASQRMPITQAMNKGYGNSTTVSGPIPVMKVDSPTGQKSVLSGRLSVSNRNSCGRGGRAAHKDSDIRALPQVIQVNSQSDVPKLKLPEHSSRDNKRRESQKKQKSRRKSSPSGQESTASKPVDRSSQFDGRKHKLPGSCGLEEVGESPSQETSYILGCADDQICSKQSSQWQPYPLPYEGISFNHTPLQGKWGDIVDEYPDMYDSSVDVEGNGGSNVSLYISGNVKYHTPLSLEHGGATHVRSGSNASSMEKGSGRHAHKTNYRKDKKSGSGTAQINPLAMSSKATTRKSKADTGLAKISPLGVPSEGALARKSVWERLGPWNVAGESILGPYSGAMNDHASPYVLHAHQSKHDAYVSCRDYWMHQ